MSSERDLLRRLAEEAGLSVEDYVLQCEMTHTVKKVGRALDRALMPDDLTRYVGLVDEALYYEEKNNGKKRKKNEKK